MAEVVVIFIIMEVVEARIYLQVAMGGATLALLVVLAADLGWLEKL